MITRIKGNQIFDGTITSANIDDTLEKEFTKVRITTDDTTPNFLYSKIDTSGSIEINVVGAAGTSQILAITGSGAPFAGGNGNDNNLITTDGNGNLIAEPNFNFNGSILNLTGSAKITGSYIHVSSGSLEYTPAQGWSSSLLRVQKYITTSDYNDGHNVAAIISIKSTALDGGVIGSRSEVINSQTTNGGIGIYGSTSTAIHASTSNNTTFLVGSSGETVLSSSTGETLGNLQTAYGTLGGVGFHGTVGAGSITNAYALYAFKTGVGASTTITTAKGLQVTNMGGTGVTNAIGVDISSQTGAATLNLGLRTQSPVVIGTTNVAGTEKLRVNGTSYFDDSAAFTLGLSGSLTKLTDGTSYLIAGDGISITSASNGAITITGNVGDITSVTAGTGLLGGGTSSDVTLSINDSVVATVSGTQFKGSVGVTGSLGSSTLTVMSGVLYHANGVIQQNAGFQYDAATGYLGIGVASPKRGIHIHGGGIRIGTTDYLEFVAAGGGIFRFDGTPAITTLESDVSFLLPPNKTLGFQSALGAASDSGFSRAAAGIINVSGSAPGAILRFNATATPLAAGDLGMNTHSGRLVMYTTGSVRQVAHMDEVAMLTGATFTGVTKFNAGLSGSLTQLTDGTSYLVAGDGISITSASNGAITITGNVGDITSVTAGTGLLGGGTSSDVTLSINDSVVATISGSRFTGNVGIKKTGTLSSPLHVSGSADASTSPTIEIEGAWVSLGDRDFKTQTFNNGIGIKFNDTNVVHYSIGQIGGNFTIAQTSADGTVLFNSDRLEILTANQSGRTAFGTSPTSARVIISGSIASDTTLLVRHGHATGASLPVLNVQNSIGTSLLYVSGSGDVGIGTTSPTSKLHVVGTVYANSLSGSLTRLSNNTSYLVAGGDISIVSSSNGQVTISSTTGKYFNSTTAGSIFTTGSAAFVGGVEAIDSPLDKGPDVFFYVSGSKDSKGTAIPGTAVFGGDVVISGTLYGGSPLRIGGGLIMTDGTLLLDTTDSIIRANEISGSLTRLFDNTSYLVAGSNISIVTGSKGNVTIETYAPGENTQMLFNNNGIIDSSENLSYNIDTSILALTGTLGMNGNIVPDSDVTYDLGSASKRWANIYTGDLHLKNDRGDWTLIEEEAFLSIRNNKTGKRFKINMEPVPELDD